MNVNPEVIFISAYDSKLDSDTNSRRNETLYRILDDLGVRINQCIGHYKGDKEFSFMVNLNHAKGFTEKFFAEIAFNQFNQESILYRDKYKQGYLVYKEGIEKIGIIDQISKEEAVKRDSYTHFPLTDIYIGNI